MQKIKRNTNYTLILISVFLLLSISIGYAALSTTLAINGTVNIQSSSWSVYFTNVQVKTGSITATTAPTTSGTSTTSLTWAVSMDSPGQFYEYTVDVKNDGSIDAMIGTLSNTSLTTNQAKYLDYKVTYGDGAEIEQYDKLLVNETVTLKVRLEFKEDLNPEDLPTDGDTVTLIYESNYVQADENAKNRKVALGIGDTVNYTASMNGVTLDNWKVFCIDGDYTTLIYGGYLPNAAIDITKPEFTNIVKSTEAPTYGIYANSNRIQLLDALQSKTNWSELLTGTINGTPIDYSETTNTNIWAMGAPTLDLWIKNWNETYPEDMIYTATTAYAMDDGLNGYYVGLTENPTTIYTEAFSDSFEGYNNTLFFPYKESIDNCWGYWLASPSADSNYSAFGIAFGGGISSAGFRYIRLAARPIVSLPSDILQ